jgi:sugar lactone lactonase YvrE
MRLPLRGIVSHALALAVALLAVPQHTAAWGAPPPHQEGELLLRAATFTTVFRSPLPLEGLTADRHGNLYSAGRGADPCPVWRVAASGGPAVVVGNLPAPCNPFGLAFNVRGELFVADGDEVLRLRPSAAAPPTATVFTSGLAGANGLAFDRQGNLWISDGQTGQGRVWRVPPDGGPATEVFRVQPLANEVNLVDGVGGVGRDVRNLPPGAITVTPTTRNAANTAGSQPIVANGLAFTRDGSLLVTDTARGAIWLVELDRQGGLRSRVGCDETFAPNTLCLDNILVAHPLLEGADGIVLDRAGNMWLTANERNAVLVVRPSRRVVEVFRNEPDEASSLRNAGPLEFPTSPALVGRRLCLAHFDVGRRDNAPSSAGEVGPNGPDRAKISCLDQRLLVPGLQEPAP